MTGRKPTRTRRSDFTRWERLRHSWKLRRLDRALRRIERHYEEAPDA